MKIFNNSQIDKVKFGDLAEEQAFIFEDFYYIKIQNHKLYKDTGGLIQFNAISLESKISLEYFDEELVQPVNLVGVIDYEDK